MILSAIWVSASSQEMRSFRFARRARSARADDARQVVDVAEPHLYPPIGNDSRGTGRCHRSIIARPAMAADGQMDCLFGP